MNTGTDFADLVRTERAAGAEDRDLDAEEAELAEDLWAQEWAAEDEAERQADIGRDEDWWDQ